MSGAVERVIPHVQGLRKIREGEWRGNCPSCGGDSRSKFSIKRTDAGCVVYCFGGCSLESILQALGMRSARELFDSVDYKPDPETLRQQRIVRGLEIWTERRLSFVCRMLRKIDRLLSGYALVLTPDNVTEANWEILSQYYKLRSDLEWELSILNSGDLQRIYDEVFRRVHP